MRIFVVKFFFFLIGSCVVFYKVFKFFLIFLRVKVFVILFEVIVNVLIVGDVEFVKVF